MNNFTDDEILGMLDEAFKKKAEETELPEALSTANIVAMLKASQAEEAENEPQREEITDKERIVKLNEFRKNDKKEILRLTKQKAAFRRFSAVAAAIAVLTTISTFAFAGNDPYKKQSLPEMISAGAQVAASSVTNGVKSLLGMEVTEPEEKPVNPGVSEDDLNRIIKDTEDIKETETAVSAIESNNVLEMEKPKEEHIEVKHSYKVKTVHKTFSSIRSIYRYVTVIDEINSEEVKAIETIDPATGSASKLTIINPSVINAGVSVSSFSCKDIYITEDNSILTIVLSNDSTTAVLFFDVANNQAIYNSSKTINGAYMKSVFEKDRIAVAVRLNGSTNFVVVDAGNLTLEGINDVTAEGRISDYCDKFTFNGSKIVASVPSGNEFTLYALSFKSDTLFLSGSLNNSIPGKITGEIDASRGGTIRFFTSDSTGIRAYSVDANLNSNTVRSEVITTEAVKESNIFFLQNSAYIFTSKTCIKVDFAKYKENRIVDEQSGETISVSYSLDFSVVENAKGADDYTLITPYNNMLIAFTKPDESGNLKAHVISDKGVHSEYIYNSASIDTSRKVATNGEFICIPISIDRSPYYYVFSFSADGISTWLLAKTMDINIVGNNLYNNAGAPVTTMNIM